MTISDADRAHLNEVMDRARIQLGKHWKQIARDGGISYETLRAARRGPGDISAETKAGIELGLEWGPGSVSAVLEHRNPTPLSRATSSAAPDVLTMSPRELAAWAIEIGELVAESAGEAAGEAAAENFLAAAMRRRQEWAMQRAKSAEQGAAVTAKTAERHSG